MAERYSQFRDKGTGIAPFLPVKAEPAGIQLPVHLFLFAVRIPFLLAFSLSYFLFLQWLPIGAIGKKAALWSIIGIPGMWWIDLRIDGVKRGSLNTSTDRFPQAGSIIASSSTSPLDALYLAAIFDPIFTTSYPHERLLERVSLLQAVLRSFLGPATTPSATAKLVSLEALTKSNPKRYIVVFPECTTSNGKGILPPSPSLLSASSKTKVYPLNLRYTAADITTPLPHTYLRFLWNLCSKPTHSIRTRIAEYTFVPAHENGSTARTTGSALTISLEDSMTSVDSDGSESHLGSEEKAFLDNIAEALARLGRVKRVGLGVQDKKNFIAVRAKRK